MKKFWRILKKVLTVVSALCGAVLFVVVLTSAIKRQNQLVCRNIQVKIDDDSGISFLTPDEIKAHINNFCEGNIIGKPLTGLDLKGLEKEEEKNPFIDKVEIFTNQQQDVIVEVQQRRPILRVINNDGVGYYLGEKDERIPLNDKFTPHVAIALGNVATHTDTKRDSTVQIALYNLINFIRRDTFLDALVDQVYVQENGELDLIPKIGGHAIHFGKVDKSMGDKMDRLKIFYREGLTRVGWQKYKSIDLRFNDQVVCEKRDTTNTFNNMAVGQTKENPVIVGLDIGTTKIAAIVAERDQFGKLKILGIGKAPSLGVTRGEVTNIKQTTDAILDAVAEAEKQSGKKITVVYVGIAGQHIASKQNRGIYTLPRAEEEITRAHIKDMVEDMHRLALDPGEKIIHVLPQEFTVDNMHGIKDPIGMCGSRLEANFHIITGKVAAAQNIKRCVERSGLQMLGLVLEPLASSAAVLHDDEMEAGVVLVDIGGGTTDVAIFKDGIIRHTAVIPFAGNIITEDIMEGCKLLRPQAEKLKVSFGSALPAETHENEIISIPGIAGRDRKEISMRTLSHIINARMEEIFAQVYFEIKSSGFVNSLNAGIVVTGGGSQMKHLKQLVEYTTGLSTRIGFPTSYLAKNNKDELKNPMYATGIGLMLKGYEEVDEMTELEVAQMFAVKPQEVAPVEILEEEEEVTVVNEAPEQEQQYATQQQQVGATTIEEEHPHGKKGNLLQQMFSSVKNWFEDENVNGDFE